MRFQERDGVILWTIYEYDGVLARRHLQRMFWPGATLRAVLKRLAKLVNNGYLARPTTHQRKTQPVPEPVYWLDWKGILWVAVQNGGVVEPPANTGENQMRLLAKQLRDQGIHWLREPRWIQLAHDLAVVDFRFAVEEAVSEEPALSLQEWRHESEFRSDGDAVVYQIKGRDGTVKQVKKKVYPDSYFVLACHEQTGQGFLVRFLLELDRATHANERFGREKIAPGLAYIKSAEYKARFGHNSGRWLVVTTGKVRMRNLMRQAQQVAKDEAGSFLFTTFDLSRAANLLTGRIWWQVEKEEPRELFAS